MALRLIAQGWQAAAELGSGKFKVEEKTRYITRRPHPEMEDVEQGDELLVVNFNRQPQQPSDPLYQSLGNRLQNGPLIDDPWDEEDDDDDDGDVPALLKR